MKKSLYFYVAVLLLSVLVLAACGGGGTDTDNDGGAGEEPANVPAEYAGKTNPMAGDQAAATAGADVYATNCASCHGDTGKGDGAAGAALDPKPAVLAGTTRSDDYLFWRINEGGAMAPFNSSMPAFKGVLSEDQIWQTVTFIKTLQ